MDKKDWSTRLLFYTIQIVFDLNKQLQSVLLKQLGQGFKHRCYSVAVLRPTTDLILPSTPSGVSSDWPCNFGKRMSTTAVNNVIDKFGHSVLHSYLRRLVSCKFVMILFTASLLPWTQQPQKTIMLWSFA